MKIRDAFYRFPLWVQFLCFALFSAGSLIVSANIGGLLSILIFGAEAFYQTPSLLLVQSFSILGGFLLPAFWLARMKQAAHTDYLQWRKGISWLPVLLAIAAYLLLCPFISAVQEWNAAWHFPQSWSGLEAYFRNKTAQSEQISLQLLQVKSPGLFVCSLLVVAAGAGLCEEFFFRGGLQNLLGEWIGNRHAAVWTTAVIFSLFHLDLFGFFPRLLLGALLGYLYVWSGTIWVPVLVHTLNNGILSLLHFLYFNGRISFDPQNLEHTPGFLWVAASLLGFAAVCTVACKIKGRLSGETPLKG
ncbi:MAG: CPBP family intramembrane metalloprotease [Bacteroidales bacterium]|nr:CPBP family intramembrane metalloprotease [Bacteroidales bacterium]